MTTLKGPGAPKTYDGTCHCCPAKPLLALTEPRINSLTGSRLRIGIVHARWNTTIIDALLDGTKKALAQAGVKEDNIVIQSVPGSYELPYAVKQYVDNLPSLARSQADTNMRV